MSKLIVLLLLFSSFLQYKNVNKCFNELVNQHDRVKYLPITCQLSFKRHVLNRVVNYSRITGNQITEGLRRREEGAYRGVQNINTCVLGRSMIQCCSTKIYKII